MLSLRRWILLTALVCSPVAAKEIDFTRYLGDHSFKESNIETSFIGTVGEGRLIISALPNTKDDSCVVWRGRRQLRPVRSFLEAANAELAVYFKELFYILLYII